MSEQGADVLDFLRSRFARMDERFDKIERVLQEHTDRLARIETTLVGVRRDTADLYAYAVSLSQRMDGLNERLDRIERRMGLTEA
jgi:hypothetical protein